MSAFVTVTTYEINPAGETLADGYDLSIRAYQKRGFAAAAKFGAEGFIPSRYGTPDTLVFKTGKRPPGWRKIKHHDGHDYCTPNKSTKIGKADLKILEEIGRRPSGDDIAREFGWDPSDMVMDGSTVYFPTYQRLELPERRRFLRLPRFNNDGFSPPDSLTEITEGQYMTAIDSHNAAVRAKQGKAS